MPLLKVSIRQKTFDTTKGKVQALQDVSFQCKEGEFITIIGPSGCGKSTLLKAIAGLDTNFDGEIFLDGSEVKAPSIDKGFIFQEPRLFPWMTVEKNIASDLPLKKAEIKKEVERLIKLIRLECFEAAYPKELSGGMAQRVAIARALLRNPKVLLLDEPFGALDAFTRSHMQEVLLDIWQENRTTMLFVTHDIDEAIYLAKKVIIMSSKPGTIREIFPVDLPFPRKKSSSSFQEIRHLLLNKFEKVDELELVNSAGI
ncbi:ABC transporter ATP-binding protein [Cytobacillus sp. Hz8]|uniref:ABC transporter ATP-binding protein n=1 Tax=Cytobacillus sp. Hz8 TaxID=3347168 RepID=UPI0035D94088